MDTLSTTSTYSGTDSKRAWYTLAVLILIMMFNNIDRYIMAVLVQPIKLELGLSDTQIGILTGFAFSAFYAVAALPLARIADGGRRRQVIWMSTLVWSVMTAVCGAAQSFFHLLVARFMVGAGEAGALPSSQSLICDVFPPERRNTALALFVSSAGIGVFCAFLFGGLLEQRIGWRLTFVAVGLPCLLLLVLFLATVPDPRKQRLDIRGSVSVSHASALRILLSNKILRNLYLGTGFLAFLQLGLPQWLPAFLERTHGMPRAEIGLKLAATSSPGMMLGILTAGPLADYLARRNRLWPARMILTSSLLGVIPAVGILIANDENVVLACIALTAFLVSMPAGLIFALSQSVVAPDERATAAAGAIIATSFIGLGALPFLTGAASDLFSNEFGPDALRWALLGAVLTCAIPLALFFSRVLTLLAKSRQ